MKAAKRADALLELGDGNPPPNEEKPKAALSPWLTKHLWGDRGNVVVVPAPQAKGNPAEADEHHGPGAEFGNR